MFFQITAKVFCILTMLVHETLKCTIWEISVLCGFYQLVPSSTTNKTYRSTTFFRPLCNASANVMKASIAFWFPGNIWKPKLFRNFQDGGWWWWWWWWLGGGGRGGGSKESWGIHNILETLQNRVKEVSGSSSFCGRNSLYSGDEWFKIPSRHLLVQS